MLSVHHIAKGTTAALAIGAVAAPAACAQPARMAPNRPLVHKAQVVPTSGTAGFEWGDAGIGAAGGLAISVLGIGGALVLSERRTRKTGTSAAVTG
ncbi:MAG: hypothetical protein JO321_09780 [Solirubrobacterales bacterium]|nr:hypothetical protein [Solirubrobacterales bacterium]MBV9166175.1 hypothetical protein [Solirubrobacterales bacterium]MBV9535688.1 hypothetical protein [Solirubrobacterales bacterium]